MNGSRERGAVGDIGQPGPAGFPGPIGVEGPQQQGEKGEVGKCYVAKTY